MKQSVQVSILGQQFHLKSDASPEQVHKVARFVEEQIQKVVHSGRAVDTLQAAILALLNVSAAHLGEGDLPQNLQECDTEVIARLVQKIEAAFSN